MAGTSKIQMDKDTVNLLLKEFAGKDGADICFENGQILVTKGSLKMAVTQLPLKSTRMEVQGKSGKVKLELTDFRLEESQVSLDLHIGLA